MKTSTGKYKDLGDKTEGLGINRANILLCQSGQYFTVLTSRWDV